VNPSWRDPVAAGNDLTFYHNASLTEHPAPDNSLAALTTGIQTFDGIDFDTRGVIQLAGQRLHESRFPIRVDQIYVGRRCRKLHLLHATQQSVGDGMEVGRVTLHYADGTTAAKPLVYGVDLRDWWVTPNEPPAGPTLRVAWEGINPMSGGQGTSIRLFHTVWENPRPSEPIESLDYSSAMTDCAPFMIAVTAEP
jgi:hypothetical protein